MYVHKGGTLYGFCPSKVSRDDPQTYGLFNQLVVTAETGQLYGDGGVSAQPDWYIDELSWFLPLYASHRFLSQARMVFGNGDDKPQAPTPEQPPARRSKLRQKGE